jgi:hypothetical protein
MLTKLNTVLLIIAISSLLFVGYTYMNEYSTTVRWQARAIKNYNTQLKDHKEGRLTLVAEPKQETWWHENPIFVAAKAWAELCGNLLAIVICSSSLLGRLWIRIKRKTHLASRS